ELGILYARSGNNNSLETTLCIAYNPKYQKLPKHSYLAVTDYSSSNGCDDIYTKTIESHVVFVQRGYCTFAQKARFVQRYNGTALISINDENKTSLVMPGGTEDDYDNITIILATILWKDFQTLEASFDVYVSMYAPDDAKVDPNMACIYLIAMFCVGVGSFWSGIVRHDIKKYRCNSDKSNNVEEDEAVDLSPISLLILVILLCGMLVSLYFFYDYLVYAVIGLFTLAGSVGLYFCCQPIWNKILKCHAFISVEKIPGCNGAIEIRSILLYLLCAAISIFWAVQRHESYAWILQNILGTAFCINMLKTIRLPNLKVCTLLLVLLFFYDIFFVFITPLFTKTGKSIMVDVATGGNSLTGEQLPMVFKFPRLLSSVYSICTEQPYSLLGFGDVLVPGLLISYNHGFDIEIGSKRLYYISSLIAYAVGLGFTYLALAFMETGQPALLYLVPCLLITTFTLACHRKEFRLLWSGIKVCIL
ncbi:hypothetical protein LOTGIDRAFT_131099, partial [Lottia gigantea]